MYHLPASLLSDLVRRLKKNTKILKASSDELDMATSLNTACN